MKNNSRLMPVAEITSKAIALLCRELGPVNTARFLNQFNVGLGNYTDERDALIGEPSVDEIVMEVKARRADQHPKAKPKHNTPRRTKRTRKG